ncbi:MAG: nuclear transport factor 2 family protein [Cyanobacteria bacterium P01_F01_bin.53]
MMSASETIQAMYAAINRRDLESAIAYVDPDCVYQDLNFAREFTGKAAVRELFAESMSSVPDDFQFIIDEITTGDALSVGLTWHVELGGIVFPNTRGVSFYKLSPSSGLLIYGRDIVESPIKPGKVAFAIIRAVTPLARRFLKPTTTTTSHQWLSRALWALVVIYVTVLLLSAPNQLLPGDPIWAIQPETIKEILAESLNFFFVLPILGFTLGPLIGISAPVVHPASEAFFNFAEAWIFMFLPLLLLDKRGKNLPQVALWSAEMFLTNVFLIPYMAQRLAQPTVDAEEVEKVEKGWVARSFGLIGLVVGTGAIAWFCLARPEFGSFAERGQYFLHKLATDRVSIAFCVDLILFWVFQSWLMGAVMPKEAGTRFLRFIPFWGLASWLLV